MSSLKSSLDTALQPLFSKEILADKNSAFNTITDLIFISESFVESTGNQQRFALLKSVRELACEGSSHPTKEGQRVLLEVLAQKFKRVMTELVPTGRFPKGFAEVLENMIRSQIRLAHDNVSILKAAEIGKPISPDANEQSCVDHIRTFGWGIFSNYTGLHKRKSCALEALRTNLIAGIFFADNLCRSKEFVLEAVRINGLALFFFSQWQNNIEVVMEAIHQNGRAIQLASQEIQKDTRAIREAVFQDDSARELIVPSLLANPDVSISLVAGLLDRGVFPNRAIQAQPRE